MAIDSQRPSAQQTQLETRQGRITTQTDAVSRTIASPVASNAATTRRRAKQRLSTAMSTTTKFSPHTVEKVEQLIKTQMLRFARRRRLLCTNGNYVEIREDGLVQGTKDVSSPYIAMQVLSIGSDMLAIWGMEAGLYLAVGPDGVLKTTDSEGRHCVFLETVKSDFTNVYESYQSVSDGSPQQLSVSHDGQLQLRPSNSNDRNCCFMWELPTCEL